MTVIDAIVDGYRDSLAAVPYGDGELVSLPTTFSSGAMLTVLVTVSDGHAFVSDRGLTADFLEDNGLELDSTRVARSFAAVRDSVGLPPVLGSEEWEITASADLADVAIAIQAISDAAMRADGLRALSRTNRTGSFADLSVNRLSARTPVVPKAKMPGRHGASRQVTLSYPGRDDQDYYLQALSGRSRDARSRSYDHASGLFLGAEPDIAHRVALLQSGSWDSWQVQNLKEVCRVIDEADVDGFVDSTAAA